VTPHLFRIEPKGPADMYKTYQVLQPPATHTRKASCAEVNCPRRNVGWRSVVDVSTVAGARQAGWIRMKSGRSYTHTQAGSVVTFTFAAGQNCFGQHRVPLHREPLLRVAGGDWRGNPRGTPTRVLRPADWVDDFGTHQLSLADEQKKG
jgi:hypothetical protein